MNYARINDKLQAFHKTNLCLKSRLSSAPGCTYTQIQNIDCKNIFDLTAKYCEFCSQMFDNTCFAFNKIPFFAIEFLMIILFAYTQKSSKKLLANMIIIKTLIAKNDNLLIANQVFKHLTGKFTIFCTQIKNIFCNQYFVSVYMYNQAMSVHIHICSRTVLIETVSFLDS